MLPDFTEYEAVTFLGWDGDLKEYFLILPIYIIFVGYPTTLALEVMKRQTLLPNLH